MFNRLSCVNRPTLASLGAVTDGVTFLPQKLMTFFSFLIIVLKSNDLLVVVIQTTVTTPTLSLRLST